MTSSLFFLSTLNPLNRRLCGPRTSLEVLKDGKICCPYQDSNPRPSSPWSSLYPYQPPKLHPRMGHERPALTDLPAGNISCTHYTGGPMGHPCLVPSAHTGFTPRPSTHSKLLYLLCWPSPQSIKNKI